MMKKLKIIAIFMASCVCAVLANDLVQVALQPAESLPKVIAYSVAEPQEVHDKRVQEQAAAVVVVAPAEPVVEVKRPKTSQEALSGVKKTVEQIKNDLNKVSLKIGKLERKIEDLEALMPSPASVPDSKVAAVKA